MTFGYFKAFPNAEALDSVAYFPKGQSELRGQAR